MNPLYQIGQKVAVCGHSLRRGWVIIPQTVITRITKVRFGDFHQNSWGVDYIADLNGFVYEVEVGPHSFREKSIRPYRDDDYKEDQSEVMSNELTKSHK